MDGVRPDLSAVDRRFRTSSVVGSSVWLLLAPLAVLGEVRGLARAGSLVLAWSSGALLGLSAVLLVADLVHPHHLELHDDAVLVPGTWPWSGVRVLPWAEVVEVRARWPRASVRLESGERVALRGMPRAEAERLGERVRLARARPRR